MTRTSTMLLRGAATLAALLLTLLLVPTAATAQQFGCQAEETGDESAPYPATRGDVAIGATVITPNANIEVDGVDWSCDTTVEITIVDASGNRTPVGTARVADDGTFTTTVTLPADVTDVTSIEVSGTDTGGDARTAASPLSADTLASPITTGGVTELFDAPATDMTPFVLGGAALALLLGSGGILLIRRQTAA